MVFTKLLLENALVFRSCYCGAAQGWQNSYNCNNLLLQRRGPDLQGKVEMVVNVSHSTSVKVSFEGSVLHLRGPKTQQPLVDECGNVLLWNGEIFSCDVEVVESENDGILLLRKLAQAPTDMDRCVDAVRQHIKRTFESIKGPWAFVYWQNSLKEVWFGRDFFGRRSLLWHLPTCSEDSFTLTSVARRKEQNEWSEVPAAHLYRISLKEFEQYLTVKSAHKEFETYLSFLKLETIVSSETSIKPLKTCISLEADALINSDTVRDKTEFNSEHDLSLCPCGSLKLQSNLKADYLSLSLDLHVGYCTDCSALMDSCIVTFFEVLGEALQRRVFNLPRTISGYEEIEDRTDQLRLEYDKINNGTATSKRLIDSKVGILFSGGIDSMVIAALADRYVPENEPIDLINVAFEQAQKQPELKRSRPKKRQQQKKDELIDPFDVPDRITGRAGLKELNPQRVWNFIEVNVMAEELKENRENYITHLVHPLDTVLDDSIGCAIWFAARACGTLYQRDKENGKFEKIREEYQSPVKVLLTGMGADEQLGGYSRHRTKFEKAGWRGLEEEMKMEIERISSRNLGRDDRCISDHGREARFPFLDEDVVKFLMTVPVWIKCDPRLPRGYGEKRLLRCLARKLSLGGSISLPKRAIQFGSRIAKLENPKEKGSDQCKRLSKNENNKTTSDS